MEAGRNSRYAQGEREYRCNARKRARTRPQKSHRETACCEMIGRKRVVGNMRYERLRVPGDEWPHVVVQSPAGFYDREGCKAAKGGDDRIELPFASSHDAVRGQQCGAKQSPLGDKDDRCSSCG